MEKAGDHRAHIDRDSAQAAPGDIFRDPYFRRSVLALAYLSAALRLEDAKERGDRDAERAERVHLRALSRRARAIEADEEADSDHDAVRARGLSPTLHYSAAEHRYVPRAAQEPSPQRGIAP